MRRLLWIVPLIAAVAVTGYLLARSTAAPADLNPAPVADATGSLDADPAANAARLPITQVTLYSNGVGLFQREGHIDGNGRVDLSFPVDDVNDLLKTMVLQDLGGGRINAVSYDSLDPLDKTLDSFAIRLAKNPCQADILTQARGEKVEITVLPKAGEAVSDKNHPGSVAITLHGTILGVETKAGSKDAGAMLNPAVAPSVVRASSPAATKRPVTANYGPDVLSPIDIRLNVGSSVEVLNLWCNDGIRSVPLADVQRIKFLNPVVESEVRRALEVLARGHDTQKKAVSLHFSGDGKRPVRVGYVVETPLWRTSYRLLVNKEGKVFVQGWALVENPTNEDWKDVRMGLVSGRPISFKMDLYQPLYVPRPVVETQLHGAVRPVTHQGAMETPPNIYNAAGQAPSSTAAPTTTAGTPFYSQNPPPYTSGSVVTGGIAGIPIVTTGDPTAPNNGPYVDINMPWHVNVEANAAKKAALRRELNLQNGIVADTTATDLGGTFQYSIDHPVSIPRQKSALLPIVNKGLEGDKVSVFNASAHPKYPLLALRLKNTTGIHLMQGPVSVFEGDGYCGDTQMPDLQPGEERLVSYALDLGTEVEAVAAKPARQLVSLKLHKGVLSTGLKVHETRTYTLKNRSPHDRVVIVEHPYRPDFKIVSKTEPKERSRSVYRFEVKVPAGKTAKLEVAEEQDSTTPAPLARVNGESLRFFLECELSNAKAKTALEKVVSLQEKLAATHKDAAQVQQQLAEITRDQERLRANLKEMPQTATAYKRYLEKFDSQETTIEQFQAQVKELRIQDQKQQEELRKCVDGLDVETSIQRAPPLPPQLGG